LKKIVTPENLSIDAREPRQSANNYSVELFRSLARELTLPNLIGIAAIFVVALVIALVTSGCAGRAGSSTDVSKKTIEQAADTKIADSATNE
jgi:hypothetical protein